MDLQSLIKYGKIIIFITMITTLITSMMPNLNAATTVKIYPSEDCYTSSYYANTAYNNSDLRVGYNSNAGFYKSRAYLKFNLSEVSGKQISSAIFSIDPKIVSNPFTLQLRYVVNDAWKENLVTWNNAPAHSTLIDSKFISNGDRINLNILSVINESDKILSLALISSQEDTSNLYSILYSRYSLADTDPSDGNYSDYWPYLNVTYSENGGTCPSADFSNVCCSLNPTQMMNFINKFNQFQVSYTPTEMMNFINKFNQFQPLC